MFHCFSGKICERSVVCNNTKIRHTGPEFAFPDGIGRGMVVQSLRDERRMTVFIDLEDQREGDQNTGIFSF
jgi:hypothetical protein